MKTKRLAGQEIWYGDRVSHVSDAKRQHGDVINVLPFGVFTVKWPKFKFAEMQLRNELRLDS